MRHMRKAVDRRRARCATGMVVTIAALIGAAPAAADTAYIANEDGGDVSVIDTSTNQRIGADIPVGTDPRGIAIAPDGSRAYVANHGDDSVSVIDLNTKSLVTEIAVSAAPRAVALSPDGSRAFVGHGGTPIAVIDTATNSLIPPGGTVAEAGTALAVTPDGSRLYVVEVPGARVTVLNAANPGGGEGLPIFVGVSPVAVAIAPDGLRAYVVNQFDGDVSVIDIAGETNLGIDIGVGGTPSAIAIKPDGSRAYVTNAADGTVSTISLSTTSVIGSPIGVGASPAAVAVTSDGASAYVANSGSSSVSVIDLATNTKLGPDITVGANPSAIAITSSSPAPVVGETVNVETVKGTIKLKCAGAGSTTELAASLQIPVGCQVNARKGTVRLTSSRGAGLETQSAKFRAGIFRVLQGAGAQPFTVLQLAGSLRCGGSTSGVAAQDAGPKAELAKKKKRKGGRKLWGKGKGKFKTKGKKGAGSVRGTEWLVADRCSGPTEARVNRGTVKFRDFTANRTVTLRRGDSYSTATGRF